MEWRECQVPGWEVSEFGHMRKVKNKKLLKPRQHRDGYVVYQTHRNGRQIALYAHQAVAYAWHGPCPKGKEVDHIDDQPDHNHYTNLQYLTHQENTLKRSMRARKKAA